MRLKTAVLSLLALLAVGLAFADNFSGPAGRFISVGGSIDLLGDVNTAGKANGSCLEWNASTLKWQPATCGSGSGSSSLQVASGGVQISSPTQSLNVSSSVFTASESPTGTVNIGLNFSSVTAQGNLFNSANRLLKLDSSGLIPNSLLDPSSVTKLGSSIDLGTETTGNYVTSLIAGQGISVGVPGAGATPAVAINPASLTGTQSWSDNTAASVIWSWRVIGADPFLTFSDGHITTSSFTATDFLSAGSALIAGQYPCLQDGTNCKDFVGQEAKLAVMTGGVAVSSPTSAVDFNGTQFLVTLQGSTSSQIALNPSTVTLLGPSIQMGTETTGDYVSSITLSSPLLGNTSGHVFIDIDRSSFTLLGPTIDVGELPHHASTHAHGEVDEINVANLSGTLADPQPVVISTGGTVVYTSTGINFIAGSGVTIAGQANGGRTDVTISATVGSAQDFDLKDATGSFTSGVTASSLTVTGSTVSINGVQYKNWPSSLGLATTSSGVFVVNGSSQVSIQPAVTDAAQKDSYNAMTATTNFVAGSTIQVLGSMLDSSLTAGTSGYAWTTRGAGLSPQWLPQSGSGGAGTPGGSPQQMQYNNSGSFGGVAVATFNSTTNLLTFSSAVTHTNVSSDTYNNVRIVLSGTSAIQYADGTVQTSSPTAGIKNQNTLQSGSTGYPDFLYVGSSETVYGPLTVTNNTSGTWIQTTASSDFGPKAGLTQVHSVDAFGSGGTYRIAVSSQSTLPATHQLGQTEVLIKSPANSTDGEVDFWANGSNVANFTQAEMQAGTDVTIINNKKLKLFNGGQYVTFQATAAPSQLYNINYTLPSSTGAVGQFLGINTAYSDHVDLNWMSGSAAQDFDLKDATGTLAANKIAAGSLGNTVIASSITVSGVTAGSYGTASNVSSFTVTADGRITGAANVAILITPTQAGLSNVANVAQIQNQSALQSGSTGYPDFLYVGTSETVHGAFKADGQITSSNTVITTAAGLLDATKLTGNLPALNGSSLTNLTGSNVGSGVPAANIAAGSLGPSVQVSSLAAVVTAGSYGSATVSNTITFNAQGQIIGASSNTIVAGAAQDFDLKDSTGSFNRLINHSTNPVVGVSSISFSGTYDSGGQTWAIRPSTYSHVPGGSAGSITFTGASSHTVEGMQFWAVANSTFTGRFVLDMNSSSSNAVGWKFLMLGPASPVIFEMTGGGSSSSTAVRYDQQAAALATKTAAFLGTYSSGVMRFEFEFQLITGATPGYVNVQIVPASGAGNNFINSESYIFAVMD